MTASAPISHPIRPKQTGARREIAFTLAPDADGRAAIARAIGIGAVKALTFKGELIPDGRRDWRLEAALNAVVVQPCVVTLAPVKTTLAETVSRRYLAEMPDPDGDEIEMPEDDTIEPLPAVIDVGAVLLEALTLALPLYPRAPGAELGTAEAAPPGTLPLLDTARRPFGGLDDLLKKPPDTG